MNGQWLKLHRKSVDSRVFSDPVMWHLWSWLLMEANWKLGYFQGFEVLPGSLATSYASISSKLNCCKSTIHKRLKKLESWGMISLKCERYFTIISICNWKTYQDYNQDDTNATRTQREQNENTTRTERETIEERKERKEEKDSAREAEPPRTVEELSDEHLAQEWCFRCKRKKNRRCADDVVDITSEISALTEDLKINPKTILSEIKNPERDRGEFFWQFKKRILEHKPTEKSYAQICAEQHKREREQWERETAERKRQKHEVKTSVREILGSNRFDQIGKAEVV